MKKTYVIAEIAQGFEGDINLCKRFIKLAKLVGANAVKFQIFRAEEICTTDYKYYDLFKSLEIDPQTWTDMIAFADEQGLDFFVDISGLKTLSWIENTKIKGYKVHSTDLKNYELLNKLKDKNVTIFLAAGGGIIEELEKAIKILGKNNIIIMSGFQAEPNLHSDVELDKLEYLKSKFGVEVGYADHFDANDSLAITLPAMAVLKGATYIEKHLTIDRNNLVLEDNVSALNPDEFVQMMKFIRDVERFTETKNEFPLSEREQTYRKNTKKVVLAKHTIEAGTEIKSSDLMMLRTGKTFEKIIDIETVIGKAAKVTIASESVITEDLIK
jgi:N,N'-diacetyllegionaminate synthase